jgi:hypothetical protein
MNSFQNTIHEATRITTHTNALIDPVLVSDNMRGESGTIDVEQTLSDHKGIYICLRSSAIQNQSYERKVWVYKNADFETLNSLVRNTDWN